MIGKWLSWISPWGRRSECPPESAGAERVVEDAWSRRRAAYATRPEVETLHASLRTHSARNHFGESLERIYGGA